MLLFANGIDLSAKGPRSDAVLEIFRKKKKDISDW